jgi:hypothetical protein
LRADFDFHPDESTVRVFTTPEPGVLRLDDDVAITEAVESGVVLRHYAFGDRWFKINVTTDLQGSLVETGDPQNRFAFNCDIATPMERDGTATYGVDLFVDVLVRADLRSVHVGDEDEFQQALADGLVSPSEETHGTAWREGTARTRRVEPAPALARRVVLVPPVRTTRGATDAPRTDPDSASAATSPHLVAIGHDRNRVPALTRTRPVRDWTPSLGRGVGIGLLSTMRRRR